VQTVINGGKECGTILWESKDTKAWSGAYVTKLLEDQKREGADHAVLVTSAMPANTLPVHLIDDVYVTRPENIISVAVTLRRDLIKRASEPGAAAADSDHAELFKYMIGDGQRHLDEWRKLNGASRELTTAMKNSHKRIENARADHDAAQEAEFCALQAELDEITRRNTKDGDDN
jgi:hypothetical protein